MLLLSRDSRTPSEAFSQLIMNPTNNDHGVVIALIAETVAADDSELTAIVISTVGVVHASHLPPRAKWSLAAGRLEAMNKHSRGTEAQGARQFTPSMHANIVREPTRACFSSVKQIH